MEVLQWKNQCPRVHQPEPEPRTVRITASPQREGNEWNTAKATVRQQPPRPERHCPWSKSAAGNVVRSVQGGKAVPNNQQTKQNNNEQPAGTADTRQWAMARYTGRRIVGMGTEYRDKTTEYR